MKQFDKRIRISVDIEDPASIQKGLNKYTNYLLSGAAIGRNGIFDIEFLVQEGETTRRLQPSDCKESKPLKEMTALLFEDEFEDVFPEEIGEDDAVYVSHNLFWAIALKHIELRPDVIECARAMVALSRRMNDVIWVDDMSCWGPDSLYMLAKEDVEMTYLLSLFFIPYWDSEHTSFELVFLLHDIWRTHGWCPATIKAFLYCDNPNFQISMVCPGDYIDIPEEEEVEKSLYTYFKNNPDAWSDVPALLAERLKDYPILAYTPRYYSEDAHPLIDVLIATMCYPPGKEYYKINDWMETYEKLLSSDYLGDTLESSALTLEKQLKEELDSPIYMAAKDIRQSDHFDAYATCEDSVKAGEYILACREAFLSLPQGEALWHHIESKGNPENLPPVEADEETFKTIFRVGGTFYTELMRRDIGLEKRPELEAFDYGEDFELPSEEHFLCYLDVLFRLGDGKPLHKNIKTLIKGMESTSDASIAARYPVDETSEDYLSDEFIAVRDAFSYDGYSSGISPGNIRRLDEYMANQKVPNPEFWEKNDPGTRALAALLMLKDPENRSAYEAYIGDAFSRDICKQVKKYCGRDSMPQETRDLFEAYISGVQGDQIPTTEELAVLMLPFMGNEGVCRGPHTFTKYSVQQKEIGLFFYSKPTPYHIQSAYWLKQTEGPLQLTAQRLFDLYMHLSPQWVIRKLDSAMKGKSETALPDSREEAFFAELEEQGIPLSVITAYRMSRDQHNGTIYQPCRERPYLHWLNVYSHFHAEEEELAGFRSMARAMDAGMDRINEKNRICFFADLAIYKKEFPFDQEEAFHRCLKTLMRHNWLMTHKEDYEEKGLTYLYSRNKIDITEAEPEFGPVFEKLLAYVEGNLPLQEISPLLQEKIATGDNFSADISERTTAMSLHHFIWSLDRERQDRLIKLFGTHCYKSIRVLSNDVYKGYLRQLVAEGKLSMLDYLGTPLNQGNKSDQVKAYEEEAYGMLLRRMIDQEIPKEHIVLFCLKNCLDVTQQHLNQMALTGELKDVLPWLYRENRIFLAEILAEYPQAGKTLNIFANDESAEVRHKAFDLLEEFLKKEKAEDEEGAAEIPQEMPEAPEDGREKRVYNLLDYGNYTPLKPAAAVQDKAGFPALFHQKIHPITRKIPVVGIVSDILASLIPKEQEQTGSPQVDHPELVSKGRNISPAPGERFGFRFQVDGWNLPPHMPHSVKLYRPALEKGESVTLCDEWTQQIPTQTPVFMGWTFDEGEEIIPGTYRFLLTDYGHNTMADQTFTVLGSETAGETKLEELVKVTLPKGETPVNMGNHNLCGKTKAVILETPLLYTAVQTESLPEIFFSDSVILSRWLTEILAPLRPAGVSFYPLYNMDLYRLQAPAPGGRGELFIQGEDLYLSPELAGVLKKALKESTVEGLTMTNSTGDVL